MISYHHAAVRLVPVCALALGAHLGCGGRVLEVDPLCKGVTCNFHGTCTSGTCACDDGYAAPDCESCAEGYVDPDGDGTCRAVTDPCATVSCGTHGHCEAAGGVPSCSCDAGYAGTGCNVCASGFQDNDNNGTCSRECGEGFRCAQGTCDDASGTATCSCQAGYAGEDCGLCAAGFQDNDDNGTCLPNCASAPACGHGTCDDGSGEAGCFCDTGYAGTTCSDCAAGYQDNDDNGTCLRSCAMTSCGAHSHCNDKPGVATCACDPGYVDEGGSCVSTTNACTSPLALDLTQPHVTGTTAGASAAYSGSCQTESGPEIVYRFELNEPLRIRFHLSGFDTVMYVRAACAEASSELACSDDDGGGMTSLIERDFEPGVYYLFADGWGNQFGGFKLDIELMCASGYVFDPTSQTCVVDPCDSNPCTQPHRTQCTPIPPTGFECACDPGYIPDAVGTCMVDPNPLGEGCGDAILLPPGVGTMHGTTVEAADDGTGTCGGQGPDRVYTFTLAERSLVGFRMEGYDSVLHLRTTCAVPATEVECNDDGGNGYSSMISTILEPGSYFLFADSYSEGGDYDMQYSFQSDPCAGDPCPGMPTCAPSPDWSSYSCVCPDGYLPYGGDCVHDPCDPNPCLGGQENRTRCERDLTTSSYGCECNLGYIETPAAPGGACMFDPNANEWTWIAFLNGDNNLESNALMDLQEMAAAGSTADVHIVALIDTYAEGNGHARKVDVTQGGYEVVEDMGEIDMGRWETLADFGVWAVQNYPAHHYALVLWDHGYGWKQLKPPAPLVKGFSNDDHGTKKGISISNGDYSRALAQVTSAIGGKIDVVGFDACLMGMWEVAEATAPYAHTFVASSETIPLSGWAYDQVLVPLVANPHQTAAQLGTTIVDTYIATGTESSTLAVSDLDTIPALRQAMSAFADALRADPTQYGKIETARKSSQKFSSFDEYRDLTDFARRVSAISSASPQLVAASQALLAQLDHSILYARAQSSHPGSHGLSIYLPAHGSEMDPAYTGAGAIWSEQTTWDEFVASFTQ